MLSICSEALNSAKSCAGNNSNITVPTLMMITANKTASFMVLTILIRFLAPKL